ncbi:MAG: hypothetical protein IPM17_04305 [Verrucomicrobia bacterium]|nr:hypothetical protein [Verrucomicrobiota bacterium]
MDWQQVIALLIVGGTVGAIVWRGWKRRRGGAAGACPGGGCGCGGATSQDKPRIIYRARKGQRPEIILKSR